MAEIHITRFCENWDKIFADQFAMYFDEVRTSGVGRCLRYWQPDNKKASCFNFIRPLKPVDASSWPACTIDDIAEANEAYSGMPVEPTKLALGGLEAANFRRHNNSFWVLAGTVLILITHEQME